MPHYCKVCQTYKANEKFSGKGHAAHICKACKGKPLPKKEKKEKSIKNPFMKSIKIQEVISFSYDERMMIIFKRGSQEYVAYKEDTHEPYIIFQFIRKEERFEPTTAFDEEMAQYAIERKADYISIYVDDWEDFEEVGEQIEAYEQTMDSEDDDEHYLREGSFVEHCYLYAEEHEQLLLRNIYQLKDEVIEFKGTAFINMLKEKQIHQVRYGHGELIFNDDELPCEINFSQEQAFQFIQWLAAKDNQSFDEQKNPSFIQIHMEDYRVAANLTINANGTRTINFILRFFHSVVVSLQELEQKVE